MLSPPASRSVSRIFATSLALRTNDAAMKSTSFTTPNPTMSCRSFSVIVGRSTVTPGKLQFFRSPSVASLRHSHETVPRSGSVSSTSLITFPSDIKMVSPRVTSRARCSYEMAIFSLVPTCV